MDKGAHAGNLIKGVAGLVGGGGGGRPNMAQAGGKNPEGIEAALAEAARVLEGQGFSRNRLRVQFLSCILQINFGCTIQAFSLYFFFAFLGEF